MRQAPSIRGAEHVLEPGAHGVGRRESGHALHRGVPREDPLVRRDDEDAVGRVGDDVGELCALLGRLGEETQVLEAHEHLRGERVQQRLLRLRERLLAIRGEDAADLAPSADHRQVRHEAGPDADVGLRRPTLSVLPGGGREREGPLDVVDRDLVVGDDDDLDGRRVEHLLHHGDERAQILGRGQRCEQRAPRFVQVAHPVALHHALDPRSVREVGERFRNHEQREREWRALIDHGADDADGHVARPMQQVQSERLHQHRTERLVLDDRDDERDRADVDDEVAEHGDHRCDPRQGVRGVWWVERVEDQLGCGDRDEELSDVVGDLVEAPPLDPLPDDRAHEDRHREDARAGDHQRADPQRVVQQEIQRLGAVPDLDRELLDHRAGGDEAGPRDEVLGGPVGDVRRPKHDGGKADRDGREDQDLGPAWQVAGLAHRALPHCVRTRRRKGRRDDESTPLVTRDAVWRSTCPPPNGGIPRST